MAEQGRSPKSSGYGFDVIHCGVPVTDEALNEIVRTATRQGMKVGFDMEERRDRRLLLAIRRYMYVHAKREVKRKSVQGERRGRAGRCKRSTSKWSSACTWNADIQWDGAGCPRIVHGTGSGAVEEFSVFQ